ncbi:MAG TPA: sulfotransferase [Acidimicrobiales bacterium]
MRVIPRRENRVRISIPNRGLDILGWRMLPNFLIVGAQKAGTTSLWHYLRSHEDVFLPAHKEPGFFNEEFGWQKGIRWYEGVFSGAEQCRAVGEASTYYTMYPFFRGVPKRIASLLPDVRIIYIMRDPIERMRSCYVQLLTDGQERRPMKEALFLDPGYVYLTRYAMQIRQYFDYFPESQIMLMTAEDLRFRRTESLRKVLSFLGVSENASMEILSEQNQSDGKRAPRASGRLILKFADCERVPARVRGPARTLMQLSLTTRPMLLHETEIDDDLRRRLVDLVLPDVAELRRWMGPSFMGWGLLTPESPVLMAS